MQGPRVRVFMSREYACVCLRVPTDVCCCMCVRACVHVQHFCVHIQNGSHVALSMLHYEINLKGAGL